MFRVRIANPLACLNTRFPTSRNSFSSTFRNVSSTSTPSSSNYTRGRRGFSRATLLGITGASTVLVSSTIYADASSKDDDDSEPELNPQMTPATLGSLVRAYLVYSMCSIPALVDASPKILSVLSSIPGVKQVTEGVVRLTFFDQFVGADTAEDAIPLLHTLRAANRGVLFAYSIEVDENEAAGYSSDGNKRGWGASISRPSAVVNNQSLPISSVSVSSPRVIGNDDDWDTDAPHKRIVDEMIHCIDVAADFESSISTSRSSSSPTSSTIARGGRTWVAVKMTALLPDASALIALSSHITLSRNLLNSNVPEKEVLFPGTAMKEDLDVLSSSLSRNGHGLSGEDIHALRALYADLRKICSRAKERGVKVIVDAEYSWYQPAIDAFTLALMREFNAFELSDGKGNGTTAQPLVYGTFQAYLRRTPKHLSLALEDAKRNNYSLGVKLVRGAYHPHEIEAHKSRALPSSPAGIHDSQPAYRHNHSKQSLSISPDPLPPVWSEKKETDECYNTCVMMLVGAVREDLERSSAARASMDTGVFDTASSPNWTRQLWTGLASLVSWGNKEIIPSTSNSNPPSSDLPGIGVLFGTHNWDSCTLILKTLVQNGLAGDLGFGKIQVEQEVVERVAIGQLYGMSDDLTDWVVSRIKSSTPFVIKYVPYGALADVMPYLSRRAIENKSVLGGEGGAKHERQRARKEIIKRLFG